jgi:hypothetical protein
MSDIAKTAASFVAAEGVNIGGLGAYYLSGQLTDLAYLAIDNVRAGWTTPGSNGYDAVAQAASLAAAGIKFDFLANSEGELDPANEIATFASLDSVAPRSVAYVEGLNEINNQPISYGGYTNDTGPDELAAAIAYQQAIYQATTTALPGTGVIYFTGYDAGDVPTGGDPLSAGLATMDNEHVYPSGPPDTLLPAQAFPNLSATDLAAAQADGQLVYTEAGYNSDAVGLATQAQYTVDLLLDDARNGIATTYLYDIADSDFDGSGLFAASDSSNPNAPKPVAVALHDLNMLLSAGDTGAVANPTAIGYSVTGETAVSYDMEMTQTDGASVIMLWNEGTVSATETVTFGTLYDLTVYDPITGTVSVASALNTGSLVLTVGADPLLLEATPVVSIPASTDPAPLICGSGPDEIKIFVSSVTNTTSFYIGVGSGNPESGGTVTPELITSASLLNNTQQEVDIYGSFNAATAYRFGIAGMAGETIDVDRVIYQGITSKLDAQFVDTGDSNNDGFGFEAYGTPTDTPVSVGSGPDRITLTLHGNEGDVHYEVGVNSEAWSDYQQTGATSANGETQQITLYGTFQNPDYLTVVLDDGQASSSVPTGGGIVADPNQTLTVENIVYNGTTIIEGATITASQFAQSFTFAAPVATPAPTTIAMTQFAAPATSGLLATPLITYNWNPQTQLARFLADVSHGTASIEFMGDSTTTGIGDDPSNLEDYAGGYPEETAYWLNQDGVAAQNANFLGNNNSGGDSQISVADGGSYSSAEAIAGEEPLLPNQGATMTFTPTNPIDGNTITTQLFGNYTGDQVQVTINGTIVAGTLTVSNSGTWDNDTLTLAQATTISSISYTEITPGSMTPVYIEGAETGNTTAPAVQVLNSGISGGTAQADNYGEQPGDFGNSSGEVPTTIQLDPSLVVINYGLNDLLYYGDTVTQLIGYLDSTIRDLQAAGEDVILCSPTPFNAGPVTTAVENQFVSALQTLAVTDHVGLIDLNDTYGQDLAALQAAGGISSNPGGVHPDATLYANIGKGIASLLANAVH